MSEDLKTFEGRIGIRRIEGLEYSSYVFCPEEDIVEDEEKGTIKFNHSSTMFLKDGDFLTIYKMPPNAPKKKIWSGWIKKRIVYEPVDFPLVKSGKVNVAWIHEEVDSTEWLTMFFGMCSASLDRRWTK